MLLKLYCVDRWKLQDTRMIIMILKAFSLAPFMQLLSWFPSPGPGRVVLCPNTKELHQKPGENHAKRHIINGCIWYPYKDCTTRRQRQPRNDSSGQSVSQGLVLQECHRLYDCQIALQTDTAREQLTPWKMESKGKSDIPDKGQLRNTGYCCIYCNQPYDICYTDGNRTIGLVKRKYFCSFISRSCQY